MNKNYFQNFYEEWYKVSEDERSQRNSLLDRDIMAMKYVATSKSVLEIGCGTGRIVNLLPARRKCGIDISPTAINYAIKKGIEGYVVDIDREYLPFKDNEFESVLCIEVLEHLFDTIHALAEANRVLVDGGRLVVTVPNIAYYLFRIIHLMGKFTDLHGNGLIVDEHIRFYTQESMSRIIKLCGFTIQKTEGALKRPVPIPERFQKKEEIKSTEGSNYLFKNCRGLLKTPPSLRGLPSYLINDVLNLWRRRPSLFAVGLVFECIKSTTPKYKFNRAVDHTKRTNLQRSLNVNLS